jgi:hypothetical protein
VLQRKGKKKTLLLIEETPLKSEEAGGMINTLNQSFHLEVAFKLRNNHLNIADTAYKIALCYANFEISKLDPLLAEPESLYF